MNSQGKGLDTSSAISTRGHVKSQNMPQLVSRTKMHIDVPLCSHGSLIANTATLDIDSQAAPRLPASTALVNAGFALESDWTTFNREWPRFDAMASVM